MENGPFSAPGFRHFATDVVLFVHNASGRPDDPYPTLAADLGVGGCSAVALLDPDGRVLVRPEPSVEAFAAALAVARRVVDLRSRTEALLPAEHRELFLTELRLGLLTADELQRRAATVDLDDLERAHVARALTDLEVRTLVRRAAELGPDRVAASVAAMAHAGRRPTDDGHDLFWQQVLTHAATASDAELAQQAFAALDARHGAAPERTAQVAAWRALRERARRR